MKKEEIYFTGFIASFVMFAITFIVCWAFIVMSDDLVQKIHIQEYCLENGVSKDVCDAKMRNGELEWKKK